MKKLILLCLIFASLIGKAQVSPVLTARVANLTTTFGQNLPIGTEVYVISDSTKWTARAYVASSETMTTAASSFFPTIIRVKGTLPITTSGTNGKILIGINDVTTSVRGTMTAADKVKLNGIATGATANTGTVTSVGLSVPTGFTATGSPVTTSGTLGFSFTSGYSLPSVATQSGWTAKQPALSGGVGFVKSNYGTITYDNSTYVTGTPWTSYGYWYTSNHPTTTSGYGLPAYPTAFPGFGTSHSLAAYGDHLHSGYITTDVNWNGGTTGLNAATGRTSLGLGTAATYAYTAFSLSAHTHSIYMVNNANNNIGSYTITAGNFILSSDIRLKANIRLISDLSKFDKITFKQFYMKSDPSQLRFGVIAQEVEKVIPELVHTDDKGMKSVAEIDMLIGIIARQSELIKSLEKRVTQLEKR